MLCVEVAFILSSCVNTVTELIDFALVLAIHFQWCDYI